MDEREMLKRIRESAEQVEIPEALKPEQIEKMLSDKRVKSRKRKRTVIWQRMAAAFVLLLFGTALITGTQHLSSQKSSEREGPIAEKHEKPTEQEETTAAELGDMYHLAADYNEVRRMIEKETDYYAEESMPDRMPMEDGSAVGGEKDDISNEGIGAESEPEYSKTNLQEVGVDESDIIKTDGSFIYSIEEKQVIITDIRENALRVAGIISPELKSAEDRINEMYVDGNKLVLIIQTGSAKVQEEETEDVCYFYHYQDTRILTYDISRRDAPKLTGEVVQDGSYQTSRKIGAYLYLFTDCGMKQGEGGVLIPEVNREAVQAGDIYCGRQGSSGLFITSVNLSEPDKAADTKLLVGSMVQIYMSEDAVYLYQPEYRRSFTTSIAKFNLTADGRIQAVNAASVPGEITDTFAINARNGYLRVLTTSWDENGEESNDLYILDEKMDLSGSIEAIAPGERIYAARFIGNMAYFVTYRNTDPLFCADLSDAANPKLLGELEVSGFSEYLHVWDDTHLLGIGYETDARTGTVKGVKLSMFDISDPMQMKEEAKYVLDGIDYTSATYAYKEVLADAEKKLIGFTIQENSGEDAKSTYLAFTYENGTFMQMLEQELESQQDRNYRGLFVENIFYIAGRGTITSYDMVNGFTFLKERDAAEN